MVVTLVLTKSLFAFGVLLANSPTQMETLLLSLLAFGVRLADSPAQMETLLLSLLAFGFFWPTPRHKWRHCC
jgi:hypothetical protein